MHGKKEIKPPNKYERQTVKITNLIKLLKLAI